MENENIHISEILEAMQTDNISSEDVLFGYHEYCTKDISKLANDIKIGMEIESSSSDIVELVEAQATGSLILNPTETECYGGYNNNSAFWLATYDSTAEVEYVSQIIGSSQLEDAVNELYSNVSITAHDAIGNHIHISRRNVNDADLLGLYIVILAPRLFKLSGRSFKEWNNWSACRYKSLSDADHETIIRYYFYELLEYGHGLYRNCTRNNTIEYRGFKTSNTAEECMEKMELILQILEVSNDHSNKLNFKIRESFFEGTLDYNIVDDIKTELARQGIYSKIDLLIKKYC